MPLPTTPTLERATKILGYVKIVVEMKNSTSVTSEPDWENAYNTLINAMINEGDQITCCLAVTILLQNRISLMSMERYVTRDQFKAFSRSIRPILQTIMYTPNFEEQMKSLDIARDRFFTETR